MTGARPNTWMPFYWADYRADTSHLSAIEHGGYVLLIGHYWTTGKPLPADDAQLARIASMTAPQWKRHRETIMAFFTLDGPAWRHGRIDRELKDASEGYSRRADAANKRWSKHNASSDKALSNGDAKHDALHEQPTTTTSKEETRSKNEPLPETPSIPYRWRGKIIRLNSADYDGWRRAYFAIPDLDAELTRIDDSLAAEGKSKGWFPAASAMLAAKHQRNLERQASENRPKPRFEPSPDIVPGDPLTVPESWGDG